MKKTILLLALFFNLFISYSQEPPTKINEVDEIMEELLMVESFNEMLASLTNFQFIYVSFNYNSDTYFSGRDIDIDQFNLTPQITYMHSKGFYASVSGNYYSEFTPNWDVTTGTIGYGKNFGKNDIFRYYGSLTGYLYSNNDIEEIYNGTVSAGIGIQNKKRTLGSYLSGTYYLGGESAYQIVSRSYINLNLLKTKKHYLKLRPQLSFITGTQLVDVGTAALETSEIINSTSNIYTLIYTQLTIPLQYNVKSFDFETGYNLNFPSAFGDETDLKNTGFFNLSVSYLIDL